MSNWRNAACAAFGSPRLKAESAAISSSFTRWGAEKFASAIDSFARRAASAYLPVS